MWLIKGLMLLALLCFQQTPAAGYHPRNLRAVDITNTSAILIWNPSKSRSVTGYAVYRYDPGPEELIANTTYQITDYTVSSLKPGGYYCYYVQTYIYLSPSSSSSVCLTTRQDVPSPPYISSITTTSRTATVSWSGCSDANTYYIGYRRLGSSRWKTIATPSMPQVTIRNLMPSTMYQFTVQCGNTAGRSPFKPTRSRATEEEIQTTLLSVETNSTFATVTWQLTPWSPQVSRKYEILVSNDSYQWTQNVTNDRNIRRYEVFVSNLSPETVYVFQVRAVTSQDGNGPWSEPKNGITLPIIPEMVLGFSDNETTVSSISVSWMKPPSTVDLYRLAMQSDTTTDEVSVVNSAERYTFHDLSPLTDYHITIWAVNKAGSGPISTVNVTTLGLGITGPEDIPDARIASLATITSLLLMLIATIIVLFTVKRSANDSIEMNFSHLRANLDDFELSDASNGSQDDYSSIRSIRVVETQSYFKSLTVPPRVPSREYTEETTTTKPSQFTTMPVYPDSTVFQAQSGWFKPTVTQVMRKKLGYRESDFNTLGPGIFYMFHKSKRKARYIDYSVNLPNTLCGIMNNLYKKERCDLNPLEVELKHFTPSAEQWCVKVWKCDKNDLLLERVKRIIQYQTLKPYGLNRRLKITSKEVWVGFSEWYMESKEKK